MTPTMYFEIDGTPVRADECSWVLIAPCGCECAWATGRYTTTEEEARDGFFGSKAVRRRDEKRGFTVKIVRNTDTKIHDNCPHVPKFGVEPRPELEGHTWAGTREGRTLHLVPLVIEKDQHSGFGRTEPVKAICRRADAYTWSTQWHIIDARVECAACLTTAKREG